MAELTCPPLGVGSIDMNALHEAAKKAKNADELADKLEAAALRPAPPPEVEAAQSPAADAPAAPEV